MEAYDVNKEEIFHVAGDADQGIANNISLTDSAFAKPQIRYKGRYGDYIMSCELYKMGNEISLNFICPKCHHSGWIKSSKKQMLWDPNKGLSVEPFECTWELDERRIEFGIGLCRFKAAIDNNRAKDA